MKKGIYDGCFPSSLTLPERFALAREAGFDGIEVTGTEDLINSDEKLHELRELSRSTVAVCSVMSQAGWGSAASPDPAEQARGVGVLTKTFRAASILGADTVLIIPAVVTEQIRYEQAWERGIEATRRLGKIAEEYGVHIALENVGNPFLLSPLEMRQFIDEVGHPLVKCYLDVGNTLYNFGYPEHWIETLGSRIQKVHVKNFRTRTRTFPTHLLDGDVNWPAVVAALRKVGYDDYLTAEVGTYKHFPRKGIYDHAESIGEIIRL
ncbi:MAG: sugar phosphate isomerase/epimerase [Armatimonadetes bacterium]|nr:sugar phosphate isomerase/epimerase [Armatimonadota bacterium]